MSTSSLAVKTSPEPGETKIIQLPHRPARQANHKCYANRHMTAQEWAVWELCRRMAYKKGGTFNMDGRIIASNFQDMSPATAYRLINRLEKQGWLVLTKTGRSKQTGWYSSTVCRPLSEKEWGAKNPHDCRPLGRPSVLTSENGPFSPAGMDRSQTEGEPFSNQRGTILTSETYIETISSDTDRADTNLNEKKNAPPAPTLSFSSIQNSSSASRATTGQESKARSEIGRWAVAEAYRNWVIGHEGITLTTKQATEVDEFILANDASLAELKRATAMLQNDANCEGGWLAPRLLPALKAYLHEIKQERIQREEYARVEAQISNSVNPELEARAAEIHRQEAEEAALIEDELGD